VNVLRRIVRFFVVLPPVVLLVALGVANDQPISLVLDPFQPANPVISVRPLPFYLYFFGALIVGVVVGGLATWMAQARRRPGASRAETDRLGRERQRDASQQLASVNR
jgi:hypothetical protein